MADRNNQTLQQQLNAERRRMTKIKRTCIFAFLVKHSIPRFKFCLENSIKETHFPFFVVEQIIQGSSDVVELSFKECIDFVKNDSQKNYNQKETSSFQDKNDSNDQEIDDETIEIIQQIQRFEQEQFLLNEIVNNKNNLNNNTNEMEIEHPSELPIINPHDQISTSTSIKRRIDFRDPSIVMMINFLAFSLELYDGWVFNWNKPKKIAKHLLYTSQTFKTVIINDVEVTYEEAIVEGEEFYHTVIEPILNNGQPEDIQYINHIFLGKRKLRRLTKSSEAGSTTSN